MTTSVLAQIGAEVSHKENTQFSKDLIGFQWKMILIGYGVKTELD